jgi:integrase
MARRSQVRYFPSRRAYYTQINGQQHHLADGPDDAPSGPTYLAAVNKFARVMTLAAGADAKDQNSVHAVLEHYLRHVERTRKPGTLKVRVVRLLPFVKEYGQKTVAELTPFDVVAFCEKMRNPRKTRVGPAANESYRVDSWGDGSVTSFIDGLKAAFRWAVKRKLINNNPVEDLERTQAGSRSAQCVITAEQHQKILAACRDPGFRRLLVCLQNTGARPSELINATASDFDADLGAVVFYADARRRKDAYSHKTAGKGKERTIYFTGEALAVVQQLCAQRKSGPVFRTRDDRPFTLDMVGDRFRLIRKKLKMPTLTPYGYRHAFATNWLLAGKTVDLLAEALGNSPAAIRKHYAHLCTDRRRIRAEIEDFHLNQSTKSESHPDTCAAVSWAALILWLAASVALGSPATSLLPGEGGHPACAPRGAS